MNRFSMVVVALVVLLAACGGTTVDAPESGDDGGGEQAQSSTSTSEAPGETTSGGVDPGDDGELTLQDFMPGPAFDENTDWRAQEMEVQQQVAECMAAEGFEYIPFVPPEVGGGFIGDDFDEEEYVKTYGFGVSTWVLQDQAFQEGEYEDPSANDPNQEIVEGMDDAERDEYFRVLWGDQPDPLADYTEEELAAMTEEEMNAIFDEVYADYEPSGCYNEASDAVYGGGGAGEAFWEEFGQDFEDVYSRAESDPRIVDAQADWSSCMADKGYDWANQEEMYGYFWGDENGPGEFQQRVDEVITWPDYGGEYVEGDEEAYVGEVTTIAPAEGEDGAGDYMGPEYDMEELQPLIDEEIAAATANYECSKDMYDLFEEVYKEYEQLFIEENLDRLVAFKEANS